MQDYSLDFVIDLHANANLKGLYIMGNSYDSVYRYERHVVFPKMMAQNCKDFSKENTIYNADEEKEGTPKTSSWGKNFVFFSRKWFRL